MPREGLFHHSAHTRPIPADGLYEPQDQDRALKSILVHGHRGARARRPENTLEAFRYAIKQGADALELDVTVTKDDVVVVSHDPVVAGGIPIRTRIHDELPREIPTLDDVFELARGNAIQFDVEAKIFPDEPELTPGPEEFAGLILSLIRRHALENRVILLCFDPRMLRVMKTLEPSIRRSALFETLRDWMEVAREFEATCLGPEYRLVTPERVAQAHAAGLQVVPWTANNPEDWGKLAAAGVDGIISDDPGALIDWLKKQKGHDPVRSCP